jgi:peptidoglycan/LPS O-acetylase OafA/YrhL
VSRQRTNRVSTDEKARPRIVELDGLRGVAVALVLLLHLSFFAGIGVGGGSASPSLLKAVVDRGYVGVSIFFVLSGFLLAAPFIRWRLGGGPPVSVRAFWLRRLWRIQPPYASVVVASAMLVFVGIPLSSGHVIASLLDAHQPVFGRANPVFVPAWSLEVEMQWYFAIPFVAMLLSNKDRMRRYLAAGTLCLISLAFQLTVDAASTRTDAMLLSWLPYFLVGWLICDLQHTSTRSRRAGSPRSWDVVSLVGWPALFLLVSTWSLQITAGPIVVGALTVAAMRGQVTGWCMRRRWLVWSGQISYSSFLVHYPIFLLARRLLGPAPTDSFVGAVLYWAVILLPITFCLAAAFHRWVERPFAEGTAPTWIIGHTRTHRPSEAVPRPQTRQERNAVAEPSALA